jgi:hypothetical protein
MISNARRVCLASLSGLAIAGLMALPAAASTTLARPDSTATTQTFWGSDDDEGTAISYAYLSAELGGYKATQCHVVEIEPAWSVELSCTK